MYKGLWPVLVLVSPKLHSQFIILPDVTVLWSVKTVATFWQTLVALKLAVTPAKTVTGSNVSPRHPVDDTTVSKTLTVPAEANVYVGLGVVKSTLPLLPISQAQLLIVAGLATEERSVNTLGAPRQTLVVEKLAVGEALTSTVIVVSCTQPLALVTASPT